MHEADVRKWITGHIAEYLVIPESEILPDREFAMLGLDSVDSLIIGGALEDRFDVEIDATMFLRNRSIDELIADMHQAGFIA